MAEQPLPAVRQHHRSPAHLVNMVAAASLIALVGSLGGDARAQSFTPPEVHTYVSAGPSFGCVNAPGSGQSFEQTTSTAPLVGNVSSSGTCTSMSHPQPQYSISLQGTANYGSLALKGTASQFALGVGHVNFSEVFSVPTPHQGFNVTVRGVLTGTYSARGGAYLCSGFPQVCVGATDANRVIEYTFWVYPNEPRFTVTGILGISDNLGSFYEGSLDLTAQFTVSVPAPITPTPLSGTPWSSPDQPPVVAVPTVSPEPSAEGSPATASATFSDPDSGTGPYTCTISYGDGSAAKAGTVAGTTCTGPAHTYADNGSYTVTITVTDPAGQSGSNATTHVVTNVAPTIASVTNSGPIVAGGSATVTVTASDPAGAADPLTYAFDCNGDGTYEITQSASSASCSFAVSGSFPVNVRVTDGDGGAAIGSTTVVVNPANRPPTANAGGPYTVAEGGSVTLSGSGNDPDIGDTLTFSWDLNGDGTFETTGQTANFSAAGKDGPGTQTVALKVCDGKGACASASATVGITNANPTVNTPTALPAIVDEGGSVTVSATFTDPGTGDGPFTCTVDYGDGTGPKPGSASGTTCSRSAFIFTDSGSFVLKVSVTDKDGGTGNATTTVMVSNVVPNVGAIVAPNDPKPVGSTISASVSFTDTGTEDTHTAEWDWGDGSKSAGFVTEMNGSGSVTGSRAYTTPGVYTVKVTVTDKDGGKGEMLFEYVVVYDPNGGFVTGGGWINSPAGTCQMAVACQGATGRANFGFVSKYQQGATTPSGQTEFDFKAGNLNFHSASYEWLVVAGARAQYKGTGTINGAGSYGFLLTAIDGALPGGNGSDKFRIKIWDRMTNAVVYDNQTGAADGAEPTTVIGGGNIVIHK